VHRASSGHGIVAMGAGGALVLCLREARRPELAPPLEAAWNSSDGMPTIGVFYTNK
jgi:hypothetical protein